MEPFIVSARKYRPQTFKDVVGQQSITNTLTNAIDNNHLAQALLFCGPRGVGKTTCARILAKKINSDGTERPDEDFAFNVFELDAASNNSVDDIRSLIDQVRIPPQVGKYKVYIIDEVHMLSQSAFNAFLKTLEEPPKHAVFILATTEKHKIIPTILSRCQIFDFKRITVKDAANYLKYIAENQGITAEEDALHIIAQKADGAMRDALSIFDRVVSFSGKQLTRKAVTENLNVLDYDTYFSATDFLLQNDIPSVLLLFNKTLSLGFDGHHFISGLASHFRDLMVCQHPGTISLLEVGDVAQQKYMQQAGQVNQSFLLKALDLANTCDLQYKSSKNQRLLVELTLMKLASITYNGEKKNPESIALANKTVDFIAPASFFRDRSPKTAVATEITQVPQPDTDTESVHQEQLPAPETEIATASAENVAAPLTAPKPDTIPAPETVSEPVQPVSAEITPQTVAPKTPTIALASPSLQEETPTWNETDNQPVPTDEIAPATLEENGNVQLDRAPTMEAPVPVADNITDPATTNTAATTEVDVLPTEKKDAIPIAIAPKRVSGLSLSSLKAKKEHERTKKEQVVDEKDLPKDPFTEETMRGHWNEFVQQIDKKGQKILASNLATDVPKLLENHTLWIELPNGTMKKEVEREQYDLMVYLRSKLNNHFITLKITVNEETAKKFAFTPEEKYEKLRAKNPAIDLLRQEFDLDL